jgi:hypothetical protein
MGVKQTGQIGGDIMTNRIRTVTILAAVMFFIIAALGTRAYSEEEPDEETIDSAQETLEPPQEEESQPAIGGIILHPRRLGFGIEVDIRLSVIPAVHTGPCPAVFTLKGQIYASKATKVLYKFIRSDRRPMTPVTLTFEKPGTLDVTDTFQISGSAPTMSEAWAFIEVISPVNVKTQSSTVFFRADCGVKEKDAAGAAPSRQKTGQALKGAGREECVRFNPADAAARYEDGAWKVGDGSRTLFAFGEEKKEAERALAVIKRYAMDQSCFVGWPRPSFHYMLVNGSSPVGPHEGEMCRAFNPAATEVRQAGGAWKITEGTQVLFDFGAGKDQADQAMAIIRKYGFTHSCIMAPGRIDLVYMRR